MADAAPQNDRSTRIEQTNTLLSRLGDLTGNADAARDLENRVVRLNMVVAREVARRYHGRGIDADDLDQVAFVGLVKAVRGYDPDKATDFHSFVVPTVRGELRRWFRDRGWAVRPPRSVQELQARVTAAQDDLTHELGRPPQPDEIAVHLGVETAAVQAALSANGCFTPSSLDAPYDDAEGSSLSNRLGGDDPGYHRAEARVALEPLLTGLTDRERTMLDMRFCQGATQAEIGERIGVTQMQVSRLLSALLTRLHDDLVASPAA